MLGYQIRKKWYAFWQKYKIKTQLKNIRKLLAFVVAVWLAGSLLTIVSQWLFARQYQEFLQDYLKYLWVVIIELVSGFDIPESIHLHPVSQIISIFMLLMGIVVVGLFTGQIITIFVHVLQRADYIPEKPLSFQFEKPIVICGINNKLVPIIRTLSKNKKAAEREIVIVDPNADQIKLADVGYCKDVWFVKGESSQRSVLQKSIGKQDCRVILLRGDDGEKASRSTITTALAIEAFDESVYTVLEIHNELNKVHFKRTKINDWICINEYGTKLIAQAALHPGTANLFYALLGDQETDNGRQNVHFSASELPAGLQGKTYHEIRKTLLTAKLDITPLGFAKYIDAQEKKRLGITLRNSSYFIQMNPVHPNSKTVTQFKKNGILYFSRDTVLAKMDKLIYLADDQVNFQIKARD
ncbi:NAD-binding protein [candidate division KSB1 bacterium]|nr:NAD-binding protein [candidate division KSB1 bacterium]